MRARKLRPGMRLRWKHSLTPLEIEEVSRGFVLVSGDWWPLWPLLDSLRSGDLTILK